MKQSVLSKKLFASRIKSDDVHFPEMLFGYLLGPLGGMLTYQVFAGFQSQYFSDVLNLNQRFLFLLPLLAIPLIILGNLTAGALIDHTHTPQGKGRPYILLSAPLIALTSILMFAVPYISTTGQHIWTAAAFLLFNAVAYPLYYTSNSLMLPLSTRNTDQRGLLATFVNIGVLGAASFASMIFPWLLSIKKNDGSMLFSAREPWLWLILILSAFSFFAILLQYFFTRERITEKQAQTQEKTEKIPLKKQAKVVIHEKYWWMIMAFYLIFQFSGTMQNSYMNYYCNYVFGSYNDGSQSILAIITGLPLALGMLVAWPLAKRFGKKNCTIVGLLLSAAGCLLAFLAPAGKSGQITIIVGLLLKSIGAIPANYVMMALLADVLDHMEAKNGFRCDGLSMSIYSIMVAIMPSLCMGVFYVLLQGTDYMAPVAGVAQVQSAATIGVFKWCYVGFMMVGYAVCAVLIARLNVEKEIANDQQLICQREQNSLKNKTIRTGENK